MWWLRERFCLKRNGSTAQYQGISLVPLVYWLGKTITIFCETRNKVFLDLLLNPLMISSKRNKIVGKCAWAYLPFSFNFRLIFSDQEGRWAAAEVWRGLLGAGEPAARTVCAHWDAGIGGLLIRWYLTILTSHWFTGQREEAPTSGGSRGGGQVRNFVLPQMFYI